MRVVPPAVARRGAYIAPNVVLMPSYVNIGAYVDRGTMVDTWATVGSCAQIGRNVHLSGGVGIGGVLEPLQANPTIIEDNCFIGARSEVVEGVIVEENSVLGMGVFIGQSTKIYNRTTGEVGYGRVPAGSVVVAGTLPSSDGKCSLYCAVIVKQVDARTRAKTSINELLRADAQPPRHGATRAASRTPGSDDVRFHQDRRRDRQDARSRQARLGTARLHHAACTAGCHDRRARSHRARLPGQRAARRARDAELRATGPPAVSGVDLYHRSTTSSATASPATKCSRPAISSTSTSP